MLCMEHVVLGKTGPEAGMSLPSWGPRGLEAALSLSLEPPLLNLLSSCQFLSVSVKNILVKAL